MQWALEVRLEPVTRGSSMREHFMQQQKRSGSPATAKEDCAQR